MKQFIYCFSISSLVIVFQFGCHHSEPPHNSNDQKIQAIAFMPDVHFHDVFADFEGSNFEGLPTVYIGQEKSAAIRTMEAQLTSTRLFNENYFAFIAALDEVVERGIEVVALPGDFSDDGQPAHLNGLVDILNHYRDEHGLQFFIAPGNHDPNRPFTREAGKWDYLGTNGRAQPIFSLNHPNCVNSPNRQNNRNDTSEPQLHDVACTDEVKEMGYEGLLEWTGEYGVLPQEHYLYYETPFSSYNEGNYDYNLAVEESTYSDRLYEICHEGSGGAYREPHYTNCFDVMDMSYLVEPMEGIWLMSVDANVYVPVENADPEDPANPANFYGSGNSGYNLVMTHKLHLLDWIQDVAERADENNKTLIAFSHFPAIDFYNQAKIKIEELWGEGRFQTRRIPSEETSKKLAKTGLKLHVAGHMHMNDTGLASHDHINNTSSVQDDRVGNILINIQVPSLAAYVPSFKILHFQYDKDLVEIETVIVEEVPNFDTLFSHYLDEWTYLDSIQFDGNWNRDILESDDYYEFADWHIRELSRLRFLPREWPEEVRVMLTALNGKDMLIASRLDHSISYADFKQWANDGEKEISEISLEFSKAWRQAEEKAVRFAENAGHNLSEFADWSGTDLSVDFYRLRNADDLAFRDIPAERFEQYAIVAEALKSSEIRTYEGDLDLMPFDVMFKKRFTTIFEVMHLFSDGLPSDRFMLNMENGSITNLAEETPRGLFKGYGSSAN